MKDAEPNWETSTLPNRYRAGRGHPAMRYVLALALLLLLAWVGWHWWEARRAADTPPVAAAPPATPPDDAPPAVAPAAGGPQHRVDEIASPDPSLPALADADAAVRSALVELLGAPKVAGFLQMDGFVRRLVATVDNLPRAHAPVQRWPARPTPGRFGLQGEGELRTVDAGNAARYAPFVQFVEGVDAARAAALYARLYPLFQQAYEELGYPGQYFNDRLVQVIDHLLAAPEPAGPLQIRVVEVRGEIASEKPWVRYEYADPALEALSAGRKLMIRMGPDNERRLKAKLRELRAQVATLRR